MKAAITLALALGVTTACASSSLESNSHLAKDIDTSTYQTFAWVADDPHVVISPIARVVDASIPQKVQGLLKEQIVEAGCTFTENADDADFLVGFTIGAFEQMQAAPPQSGYTGTYSRYLIHNQARDFYGYQWTPPTDVKGVLTVDVFDKQGDKPVWQGWSSRTLHGTTASTSTSSLNAAISHTLNEFPAGACQG